MRILFVALLLLFNFSAFAQDSLKVAVGQIEVWSAVGPTLGDTAGIFNKHGLNLEILNAAGAGETVQAVISGSADVAINVGISGVLRAFQKGAPIRILGANYTGGGDIFWYVKADSPIKTLKDATAANTIAYSTNGSSTHNIVLGFVSDLGVKAKPTSTGAPTPTLTAVMSGQIDIGWGSPPLGVKEVEEGQIRVVASGNDLPAVREQTVRVDIVNADALKTKRDAILRFVRAYRETLDWMYADPAAIKLYADFIRVPESRARIAVEKFSPKESRQFDQVKDIDGIMRDAVKLKFLDEPLSKAQQAELIQIPPR
jgi:NitT/TauT family transport system substrate-binding protein